MFVNSHTSIKDRSSLKCEGRLQFHRELGKTANLSNTFATISIVMKITALTFLICLMHLGLFAEALPHVGFNGRLRRALDGERELYNAGDKEGTYDNRNLLDMLMARPSKRQWCRKGMIYNHVLGSCTMSLSALRGISKWS